MTVLHITCSDDNSADRLRRLAEALGCPVKEEPSEEPFDALRYARELAPGLEWRMAGASAVAEFGEGVIVLWPTHLAMTTQLRVMVRLTDTYRWHDEAYPFGSMPAERLRWIMRSAAYTYATRRIEDDRPFIVARRESALALVDGLDGKEAR